VFHPILNLCFQHFSTACLRCVGPRNLTGGKFLSDQDDALQQALFLGFCLTKFLFNNKGFQHYSNACLRRLGPRKLTGGKFLS
jgi:hypothetical protein